MSSSGRTTQRLTAPSAASASTRRANKLGLEIAIASAPGNDRALPSVAGLSDGGFYVNFTQDSGDPANNFILGAIYDANGVFVRSQPVIFAFGPDTHSDTARLGTGSVVAWVDPEGVIGDDIDLSPPPLPLSSRTSLGSRGRALPPPPA